MRPVLSGFSNIWNGFCSDATGLHLLNLVKYILYDADLINKKSFQNIFNKIITLDYLKKNPNILRKGSLYYGLYKASYKEAEKSLELRLLYGSNNVLTFLSTPENFNVEILDFFDDNRFMNSMASLNYDDCKIIITKAFDRIKEFDMAGIDTIKMIY